jgi:transposase, IS30 family
MGLYRRLQYAEREEISRCFARGESLREAARQIKRHPSTLSRELYRTGYSKVTYRVIKLFRGPRESYNNPPPPRRFLKIERNPDLGEFIRAGLKQYWSPDQIARALKRAYPGNKAMQLSHETLYQYLYVLGRGELKKELTRYLRRKRPYRRKRLMVSIEERPLEVADRSVPGHWEGDFLMGGHQTSALGTMVERQTRLLLLVPIRQRDMVSVRKAFAKAIRRLPTQMAKSLTYDQGFEMRDHRQLTLETNMIVYFCHPHSPWERGTCENTNGLLRQFFPKGTDFNRVSTYQIRKVEKLMNGRPRKVLDGASPSEVFHKLLR